MTKSCKECRADLVAYHDRELPDRDMRIVREHLAQCGDCRREFEFLQEALQQVEAPALIAPSDGYDRLFWDKVRALRNARADRRTGLLSPLWALLSRRGAFVATGALALCVCIGTLWVVRGPREPSGDELAMARHMDLFANYEVIEKSEALEHFEVISMLDALTGETAP